MNRLLLQVGSAQTPVEVRHPAPRRRLAQLCALLGLVLGGTAEIHTAAVAQTTGAQPGLMVPGFWDPRRRPERPDLSRVTVIRFLTEIDYPPFNFPGPDGNPT